MKILLYYIMTHDILRSAIAGGAMSVDGIFMNMRGLKIDSLSITILDCVGEDIS